MIPSFPTDSATEEIKPVELPPRTPPSTARAFPVKFGRVLDQDGGGFGLEYDNTRGEKNWMRLDARTYEGAIREARSYLGIQEDDRDEDGDLWAVE